MTKRLVDPAGLVFGIMAPLAAAAIGVLLTWAWETRLPDQIAVHWGFGGRPDDFAEPMSSAWVFALIIVLVGAGAGSIAALAQALLLMRRAMVVVCGTVVGLMLTLQVTILSIQLDRSATDARLPGWTIALGTLVGFAVGALGAALLRDYRERRAATTLPAPDLVYGPAVPVSDAVGFGPVGWIVTAVVILGVGGFAGLAAHSLWPLAVMLPVLVLLLGLTRFDVGVDGRGLWIRSLGMLTIDIDLDEIEAAKVVPVRAIRDFGGWGLRLRGRRRYGIITQTGPAVEVTTAGGMQLTVTTEKAEQMAGALNSYAVQARS